LLKSKILAGFVLALVLTNLISLKQNADLFAKIRDVDPEFVQEGVASWYGPGFQGRKTANGERFDTYEMTAAHKTLPFNTLVKVTNLDNGVSAIVRINDRGPFVRGRIIDLSNAAKNTIQMGGTAQVRIEIINPEEEQTTESETEENLSPVNIFEEEFPAASKIFVEWMKDSTVDGKITDEQLSQILNSSKVKIKVLTPDVEDANSKIYQEVSENNGFNYFEVTSKIKFITGYTLEVANLSDNEKASELIEKLESKNFKNIFLEEIVNGKNVNFKVYTGNYKTLKESKDDLVRLLDMDYNLKSKIVKISQ
jgi:rare lipoprotein A (peptidoglycan hydrolase)